MYDKKRKYDPMEEEDEYDDVILGDFNDGNLHSPAYLSQMFKKRYCHPSLYRDNRDFRNIFNSTWNETLLEFSIKYHPCVYNLPIYEKDILRKKNSYWRNTITGFKLNLNRNGDKPGNKILNVVEIIGGSMSYFSEAYANSNLSITEDLLYSISNVGRIPSQVYKFVPERNMIETVGDFTLYAPYSVDASGICYLVVCYIIHDVLLKTFKSLQMKELFKTVMFGNLAEEFQLRGKMSMSSDTINSPFGNTASSSGDVFDKLIELRDNAIDSLKDNQNLELQRRYRLL